MPRIPAIAQLTVCFLLLLFVACEESALPTANVLHQWVDPMVGTASPATPVQVSVPFGMVAGEPRFPAEGKFAGFELGHPGHPAFLRLHTQGDSLPLTTWAYDSSRFLLGQAAVRGAEMSAELTATSRTVVGRFSFPPGEASTIWVEGLAGDAGQEVSLAVSSPNELVGTRRDPRQPDGQAWHFVLQFSRPFSRAGLAMGDSVLVGVAEKQGPKLRAFARFSTVAREAIRLRVAFSPVSFAGARRNLQAEAGNWNYDQFCQQATAAWDHRLQALSLPAGSAAEPAGLVYTGLSRSLRVPALAMDVDSQYRAPGGGIFRDTLGAYYHLPETAPLMAPAFAWVPLLAPEVYAAASRSTWLSYQQGGSLPTEAGRFWLDALHKGVPGLDTLAILDALVVQATQAADWLPLYDRQGFLGADQVEASVSRSLWQAQRDGAVAAWADLAGKADTARRFRLRAQAYRHLYDQETGFFRPKWDDRWLAGFEPGASSAHFGGANAWQYRFAVPHDMEGYAALNGGTRILEEKLDAFFAGEKEAPAEKGLMGWYDPSVLANQVVPFYYLHTAQPPKTQRLVRQLLDSLYAPLPGGLPGPDGYGQQTAWYAWAALGLFPDGSPSPRYLLTSPLFSEWKLALPGGDTFSLKTEGFGKGLRYIQRATLNGEDLRTAYLTHTQLLAGGELLLELGPDATTTTWATAEDELPTAALGGMRRSAVPFVQTPDFTFSDSVSLRMGKAGSQEIIHFTLDGSPPDTGSPVFAGPLVLREPTQLRAFARQPGQLSSPEMAADFRRLPPGRSVALAPPPAAAFPGNSPEALIDLRLSPPYVHSGFWQGFQADTLLATVNLGAEQTVRRIELRFLHLPGDNISAPPEVTFFLSADGQRYLPLRKRRRPFVAAGAGPQVISYEVVTYVRARYLRAEVICEAGQWLLADEFLVE